MDKKRLFALIDSMAEEAATIADRIYDKPELGFQEYFASALLKKSFQGYGFTVEQGVGGIKTAFRAEWKNGIGGPVIGLICEYDALEGLGHACGHHLQGPASLAAAVGLKEAIKEIPYTLVIYGTPAEENHGGKIKMIDAGCFRDLDLVMMFHSGYEGGVCEQYLASLNRKFQFIAPEEQQVLQSSALDAIQLAFAGVEQLRAYLRADGRLHYTIMEHDSDIKKVARASLTIRSKSKVYNDEINKRINAILDGAAMMTGTIVEDFSKASILANLLCVPSFTEAAKQNVCQVGQPYTTDSMLRVGSSDFSNVSWIIPSCCIYATAVPYGVQSHTVEYLREGKKPLAHDGILYAAKTMAGTYFDLLQNPEIVKRIKAEFKTVLQRAMNE